MCREGKKCLPLAVYFLLLLGDLWPSCLLPSCTRGGWVDRWGASRGEATRQRGLDELDPSEELLHKTPSPKTTSVGSREHVLTDRLTDWLNAIFPQWTPILQNPLQIPFEKHQRWFIECTWFFFLAILYTFIKTLLKCLHEGHQGVNNMYVNGHPWWFRW